MCGTLTGLDIPDDVVRRFLPVLAILLGSRLAPVLALPLARRQLVRQQKFARVELMQQQHLYALCALALHST